MLGNVSGICIGVVLGGGIFEILGYFWLFIVFGCLLCATGLFLLILPENITNLALQNEMNRSFGYCQIFRVLRTNMAFMNIALSVILYYTLEPTLALKLKASF